MGFQPQKPQGPARSAAKQPAELSKDVNGLTLLQVSEGQEEVKGKKNDKGKDSMKRGDMFALQLSVHLL